jgi:hypothetical protein
MKKSLFLTFGLTLSLLAANASGRTLKVPEDKPVISVTIPDGWKHDTSEKGVTCQSTDDEAALFFEVTSAKGTDALIDENLEVLKDQHLTIDKSTQKTSEFEANGMKWSTVGWDGKDDSGPETVLLAFADVGNGNVLMVTYWVTKKAEKEQKEVINKILDSMKKI